MKLKSLLVVLLVLILLGSGGTAYYFFSKYQATQKLLADPTAASQQEIAKVSQTLSKFMELPDEEPTLATVLDKEKLKDQPFFEKAENGDKVIIYTKSGKAILFRPGTNRIINIAPISLGAEQSDVNLAVYNGSGKKGFAQEFASTIEAAAKNVKVLSQGNAKGNYTKSLVIDLTGNKKDLATEMATLIKGEVAELPSGEVKPENPDGKSLDLLVILGSDMELTQATPTATPAPSPTQ